MLEVAKLYRENERYREALQLCRLFIVEMLAHPHNPRILGPEDGLIELARVEAAQGSLDRALETLARVKDVPNVNPRVASQALLERGKILDQLGKRELALAEYQKVVQSSPDPDMTKQARAYQKRPYRPGASN
jgi:tetratricopeptide (TPR) repeat protein